MKRIIFILITALSLSSCIDKADMIGNTKYDNERVLDQCLRQKLFKECLESLPAGPKATKYNDWDEVVDSCQLVAQYHCIRKRKFVKEECLPGD